MKTAEEKVIISLVNVSKKYKNHLVLNNVTFDFFEGKVYLLVGSNGSGKTTLIKGILDLIHFSKGEVIKDEHRIAFVPERIIFPEFISVYDFLYNIGLIKKIPKLILEEEILSQLAFCQLPRDKKIKALSKGMYQKVLIIQALIADSDLYIFDEVLNGLDITMQKQFLDCLWELKAKNKTIILATHYPLYFHDIYDILLNISDGEIREKLN